MNLIERESELAQLATLTEDARAGVGSFVLVSGEAGAGKSALLSAFITATARSLATPTSLRVVAGACDGLAVPRPLGPVIDIAAQLEIDVSLPRHDLFAGILDALTHRSTVVLIEDAHWADDATADFLLFVARRVDEVAAMIVVTYRDDERDTRGVLSRLTGELLRLGTVRRLPVRPLTADGIANLTADSVLDPTDVLRRTSGNAFFVAELLAAGTDDSTTIRDVVLSRYSRLSAAGRRVADVASQLGIRFGLDLLAEISAPDEDGIDDCVERGILVTFGSELAFRHELTRSVIADEIPPIRRASLNRAILRVLEQRPDTDLTRLAIHSAAANEADPAYRYGRAAGQAAARVASHCEAVLHFRTAARFASQRPPRDRAELLDELADECLVTDQLTDAAAAAEESLRLWVELDDPIRLGAAHLAMGDIHWHLGQGPAARTHIATAVSLLDAHPTSVVLARAVAKAATNSMLLGLDAEAIATGGRALEIAEAIGDAYAISDVLNTIGCSLTSLDRVDEGIEYLERSLEIAKANDFGHLAGRAYANLASVMVYENHFVRADQLIAEGLRYAEDRELTVRVVCLTGILADYELLRGRWDDALTDALGVLRTAGAVSIGQIPALTVIGTIRMRRGEDSAGPYLADALKRAQDVNEIQRVAPLATALAERSWLSGDVDGARSWLDLALGPGGEPDPYTKGQLLSWDVRLGGSPRSAPAGTPLAFVLEIEGRWDEAAAVWRECERPYDSALALLEVGTPSALTDAFQIFVQLGARPAEALAAARLRALGERVPRGGRPSTRSNPAGLTARELEVLQLIADGLTNTAIARRLYISEKTVQHHVSSILAKLDVPSRREAAIAARELGVVAAVSPAS